MFVTWHDKKIDSISCRVRLVSIKSIIGKSQDSKHCDYSKFFNMILFSFIASNMTQTKLASNFNHLHELLMNRKFPSKSRVLTKRYGSITKHVYYSSDESLFFTNISKSTYTILRLMFFHKKCVSNKTNLSKMQKKSTVY